MNLEMRQRQKAILMFKILHDLSEMFTPNTSLHYYEDSLLQNESRAPKKPYKLLQK